MNAIVDSLPSPALRCMPACEMYRGTSTVVPVTSRGRSRGKKDPLILKIDSLRSAQFEFGTTDIPWR